MTPGQFLRRVWPSTGFYCIAHPFKPANSSVTVYAHKVFATISEAVTHVHEMTHTTDCYFAVLSLAQERVWDADKTDYKTGQKGAWAIRKQENMHAARAVFFDLDVGPEAGKYPTQRDALAALLDFLTKTLLPMPTLVSSGGGVHVYWHLDADVLTADWRKIAWHMRQLAEGIGLKVDPTRTIDSTSVLRVADTFNWKDRQKPRPVKVMQEGVITPVAAFEQLVSDAMIRAGVVSTEAPAARTAPQVENYGLGSNTQINDFGPKPILTDVAAACGQVQEILRAQGDPKHPHYGQLDNTAWYRGMLATIKHVEDGDNWCRKLTALHPRSNADIDAKLLQLEQFPPARCETLAQFMPWKDEPCKTCRFRVDPSVPNPIAAARRSAVAAPPSPNTATPSAPSSSSSTTPPVVQLMAPSAAVRAAMIPNPPKPYERLKAGGIAVTRKDKDDNDITSVIYPHDLYPLKRLVNTDASTEQQVWRTVLPRSGIRDFTIDADVLYDQRKFCVAISNNGIYPNKADLSALQDYMVAYIAQLQKELDGESQRSHLGWSDDYQSFILPDKTLKADGTVMTSALTENAERASQFVTKRGTLQAQVELLRFYDHPAYIPNQLVILGSLASIVFYATGHHGIVVNCSGDAGASKSTTLYTAASLWGDPVHWPINGTNRGATANARAQRIATNANLPTCVDEITHIPAKEAIDLVMNITQPGHRIRLSTDGNEQKQVSSYKSAIMIATANSSLHALLSTDNAAGTAGSMRVFEMQFVAQAVHTKAEADEFLRQIKLNYGHIGEIVTQFVVRNREAVEKRLQDLVRAIDEEAGIKSSERFWSAYVAAAVVMGEITQALRLLPYDPAVIRHWAVTKQIPHMRGVVSEEYRDSLSVLTDYIADKAGNIVVVDKTTSIGQNTSGRATVGSTYYAVNKPHGALLGHYDMATGILYLLKQGFREHCQKQGSSATKIVEELNQPRGRPGDVPARIVLDRNKRVTLGANTDLAKGQSWCFVVDMKHPEIAGAKPVLATSSGTPANDVAAGAAP